jgi:hypothetical protein
VTVKSAESPAGTNLISASRFSGMAAAGRRNWAAGYFSRQSASSRAASLISEASATAPTGGARYLSNISRMFISLIGGISPRSRYSSSSFSNRYRYGSFLRPLPWRRRSFSSYARFSHS